MNTPRRHSETTEPTDRFDSGTSALQTAKGITTEAIRIPDWRAALRAALHAFVLSRMLIVLAAAFATAVDTSWTLPEVDGQPLRLFAPEHVAHLLGRVLSNDAGWYMSIVEHGYEARPFDVSRQANWAFFPLHPLIWKAVLSSGLSPTVGGLLLANMLFFLSLLQLHRWVQVLRDESTATRAVLCVALFPTSYFFSLPWSESLYLLLLSSALLAVEQRRWWASGVIATLISATRPTGILLAPLIWWEGRKDQGLAWQRRTLIAAMTGLGIAAFMLLLWQKTGNPKAFADIQYTWGRNGGSLTKELRRWLADPLLIARTWNLLWLNHAALLLGLAASAWLLLRRKVALAGFLFMTILLPWATGTLMSMARYIASCAPLFLVLACWLDRPFRLLNWLLVSTCLLVAMSACFALGFTFAGA